MLHRPPVKEGGTFEVLEAHIVNWAAAAGLTPSVPRLDRALRYRLQWQSRTDWPYLNSVMQIFEVVRALGFPVMPEPRAYEFDPDDEPFAEVTSPMWGLASRALSAAAYRAHYGEAEQPPAWEVEAIALEMDVYAALYGGGRPLAELAARAAWVSAAHEAAEHDTPPPPREIIVQGQPVTNMRRIMHDLGPQMIANQVTFVQAHGKDMWAFMQYGSNVARSSRPRLLTQRRPEFGTSGRCARGSTRPDRRHGA